MLQDVFKLSALFKIIVFYVNRLCQTKMRKIACAHFAAGFVGVSKDDESNRSGVLFYMLA